MTTTTKTRSTIAATLLAVSALGSATSFAAEKPTVILVHGAFAESASWNGVASRLIDQGYPVVAAANPLRGVANDAEYVSDIIEHTAGPIVLVGHSYGGSVITNAVKGSSKVKARLCGRLRTRGWRERRRAGRPVSRQYARPDPG